MQPTALEAMTDRTGGNGVLQAHRNSMWRAAQRASLEGQWGVRYVQTVEWIMHIVRDMVNQVPLISAMLRESTRPTALVARGRHDSVKSNN